jgi:hypothetical protein
LTRRRFSEIGKTSKDIPWPFGFAAHFMWLADEICKGPGCLNIFVISQKLFVWDYEKPNIWHLA